MRDIQATIKPLDKEVVLAFLNSFKDLDYSFENAKQRLIDLFVNRVVLFDDHCEIYFNVSNDKVTQLKLSEQPDLDREISFEIKKQPDGLTRRVKSGLFFFIYKK